jgi:hypothetical protein
MVGVIDPVKRSQTSHLGFQSRRCEMLKNEDWTTVMMRTSHHESTQDPESWAHGLPRTIRMLGKVQKLIKIQKKIQTKKRI